MYLKCSFLGYRALHACGGRWRGRFLSQKPSQNQRPDIPPMSMSFETRFSKSTGLLSPRRVLYKAGGAAENIDLYVHAHEYGSPLEYAASYEKR